MSDRELVHGAPWEASCTRIDHALAFLGRSRCGAVLAAAFDGASRYRDFASALPGISHAVLTARLRELVAQGLLTHTEATYALTPTADLLRPVLNALADLVAAHPDLFTPSSVHTRSQSS